MDQRASSSDDQFRADIPRYVAGALSPTEREAFEAWLLAHPEMVRELELERMLRVGMASAARRGWLEGPARAPRTSLRWTAAAASVIGAISLSAFTLGRLQTNSLATSHSHEESIGGMLEHTQDAPTIVLASTRSGGTTPDVTLALAEMPDHLVLRPDVVVLTCEDGVVDFECAGGAKPSLPQYERYELDIVHRGKDVSVWRSAAQKPRDGSELAYVIHPRRLEAGDYQLIVSGTSATHREVVGRFWLRVAANDSR
jgi:hypothetical protein